MTDNDVFQLFSVLSFPFLSTGTRGSSEASKLSTHVNTLAISYGGDFRAFKVWKSFTFNPPRAALAFSTNGRASSKSFCTFDDSSSTSNFI